MQSRRTFLRNSIGLGAMLAFAPGMALAEPGRIYWIQYSASKELADAETIFERLISLFPDQSYLLANMEGSYKVLNNTPVAGGSRTREDTEKQKELEDIILTAHGHEIGSMVRPMEADIDRDFIPIAVSTGKKPDGYYVMISSNSNDDYARDNVQKLMAAGFTNIRLTPTKQNGTEFTRTLVGEYKTEDEAEAAAQGIFRITHRGDHWLDDVNIIGMHGTQFDWIRPMQNPNTEKITQTEAKQRRIEGISIDQFFMREVTRYNKENGTDYDPSFIMALAYTESKFKLDATGHKLTRGADGKLRYQIVNGQRVPTARGLMQVSMDNLRKYDVRDWRDPSQNLRAGLKHMQYVEDMLDEIFREMGHHSEWRRDKENRLLVLGAAYNGGEFRVKSRLIEAKTHRLGPILDGLPAETRRHIETLSEQYQMLRDNKESAIALNGAYQGTFQIH